MNKRVTGTALLTILAALLAILCGVATVVLAQQRPQVLAQQRPQVLVVPGSTPGPPHVPNTTPGATSVPMTPAQLARDDRTARLDAAAEADQKAGDYAQAEADARRAMASGSDAGTAQEILAASLYAQGKTQGALRVYHSLNVPVAYAGRNEWPYALLLLKAGHWAQAVAAYDTALGLGGDVDVLRAGSSFSPDVPQPAELAAAIHIGMGLTVDGGDFHGTYRDRIAQGQAHFQRALSLAPDSALTNYYVGYGLQRLGRWPEAKAAFQRAADLGGGDIRKAAEEQLNGR